MAKKLNPAELVVARFAKAGVTRYRIAVDLEYHPSMVYQWQRRKRIPSNYTNGHQLSTHQRLLLLAKQHAVKLTADELNDGGTL